MNKASNHKYDHQQIETKWQEVWENNDLFQDTIKNTDDAKEKMYLLFAFAYPSGSGLHVGHVESKTALDILARYNRMHDKEVFFPVGWDAFGLPAENYAIKTGVPPAKTTKNAIDTFRRQIKRLGISYDWKSEIATCHPGYYKWTQWLFLQLYKEGLAYQDTGMVNWCPSCQTVLANEQVVEGLCERCDTEVEQKDLKQWYFKITNYKDELISGLEELDWPNATKHHQLNWIGKKEGIDIRYRVISEKSEVKDGGAGVMNEEIICFTTRPDTNFGATFVVLAPEHDFAKKIAEGEIAADENGKEISEKIKAYLKAAQKKTELERQTDGRKKSGVFTGFYAVNNLTGKKMPIWVSDFVLGGFGTGAVIGVPGHDKRDFEFVQFVNDNYPDQQMEVIRVVVAADGDDSPITKVEQVQEDEGTMVNSEFLDGLDIHEATQKIMDYLEEKDWGKRKTSYKLRDWLISRQRYWGAPIPVVYDPEGKPHPVKEEHLPWKLPEDVDFKPTGESPLRSSKEFIARTEQLYGKGWRPEFDTMDTFVDSSWYFMRYLSARDEKEFASKDKMKQWLPVDLYLIGPEHIVLHLLYSRFFTKFLRDQDYLKIDEPFAKMRHQGMIMGPDGKKMSKSKGNVINPDEIVNEYGADTLRVYEMFMGPLEADKPWDISSVRGVRRFLQRVHDLVEKTSKAGAADENKEIRVKLHQVIKKVTEDIPKLKFNTAIAAMMEFVNDWTNEDRKAEGKAVLSKNDLKAFVKLLAPFTPFLAEELWRYVINDFSKDIENSIHVGNWPKFDLVLAKQEMATIVVQINGKVRGELQIASDQAQAENKEQIIKQAKKLETVAKWLEDKKIKKEIYVPGRIVSLVI